MKKMHSILLFLPLLMLGVLSCETDTPTEADFISSKINNEQWNGVPEIDLNSATDTLTLLGAGNEQVIAIKIKFQGTGDYDLSGTQANFYTTIGGDVISSLYTLDANQSSQISITAYDKEQQLLQGNFELSLLKKWSNPENNNDVLRFTQGRFKGTISN